MPDRRPETAVVVASGREVTVTNPRKVFFSARGETKLDLAHYYVRVGDAALRGVRDRPTVLKRYPDGAEGPFFFQHRVPAARPSWVETVPVRFADGRHGEELCPVDVAHLVFAVNLGCIDLNPWAVRRADLEHPDELRVDLDPSPGVEFAAVRAVALEVRAVLEEHGMTGFPKTSGSRGMHVLVRIAGRFGFEDVHRAAKALALEVERRRPDLATTTWWKRERGARVLFDYHQNARDRSLASAYSVRPNPEARVSCPLTWSEVPDVHPSDCTLASVPALLAERGDPAATIDERPSPLEPLLETAARSGLS
jgi:DNA ligase D-like protein (predicted polymerase)